MRHENQTNDPIFLSAFRALLFRKIIFTFENCQSLFSWGPLWSVMVCKILNFEGESCEIRILFHSLQETYTLRKVKNQVLLFLLS